jgi:hypothetical protein
VFDEHGVRTLADVEALMLECARLEHLDAELKRLPGEGRAGVRRGYLWMLADSDDLVKPDRMVLSALRHHGVHPTAGEAGALLRAAAVRFRTGPAPFTAWDLDHALWRDRRQLTVGGVRWRGAAPAG